MEHSSLLTGKNHVDDRGKLSYWNEFNMENVQRMYTLFHDDTTAIRAWQGHKMENKWMYVIAGAFRIVLIRPDNWVEPSKQLPMEIYDLNANSNDVLYIPGGHASGFKAQTKGSKMIVFSDMSVEQSSNDDYRFKSTMWYKW